ncbi:biotin synthase BioB [Corynebacterium diphtheriae]|nr:biotin synthase BioB [Corynebacterium diphtheriae]CAB0506696.1 biotin synthase BioB [Corynebacterium diphtheriae]CAB0547301.1 biotin synthase BioB [Corynebacterium diphtheriae]CAB0553833.1 biotin synthase BioB [Corynebacterium diphtheriae]CAB0565682.1 biotin synthase BioB [Corynebacterium diphtheriae]
METMTATLNTVQDLEASVLAGTAITRDEALSLIDAPLDELSAAADRIRAQMCGDGFDMCSIINAKSGRCPENCTFCAQSIRYPTISVDSYPLITTDELVRQAQENKDKGVIRFSIVTSGRKLRRDEVRHICEGVRRIKQEVGIEVCISAGLLSAEDFQALHDAGISRVHCNLETSRAYFPSICTSHTFDDKIATLQAARDEGMSLCSGGILGLGESMEDRIDMALSARELGVNSFPVNVLVAIEGTPLAGTEQLSPEEVQRCVAIFRFILPQAAIRLAGGRELLGDDGKACFQSGANSAISGDMLTTTGTTIASDMTLVQDLGYTVTLDHSHS